MKISVIIPSFNRGYTLNRCIDSVLNQKYLAFEIIVVDDGSTDESATLLESYEDQIQHYRTENKGVSAARNFAVSKSSGEWLAFLDSDDEWLPNRLLDQVKLLKDNPLLNFVHGEEIWIRNGKRINQKKIHKKSGGNIYRKCLPLCCISPSASLIKKEIYLSLGGFDEDYIVCEDYYLWLKLTARYEIGFVETPIINKYGGHEDQLSKKYFAMDIWRVRAMISMLDEDLSIENMQLTVTEIKKKATILIQGYQKHQNLEDLPEVLSYLERARLTELEIS